MVWVIEMHQDFYDPKNITLQRLEDVRTWFGKVCEHEEGIILMLASTKFPLTSFAWKIKKQKNSEVRNIENWWCPSSLEAPKKTCYPELNIQDFSLKHLIALFNMSTPPAELLNKSQQKPNKNTSFFRVEMFYK